MARLIFIGAGGVGTYLGGWRSHTGHDVTLVEHWAEQVEKITADEKSFPVLSPVRVIYDHITYIFFASQSRDCTATMSSDSFHISVAG